MKELSQLLELAKNPYYKFTQDEQAVLDDFLLKKQAKPSKKSQKQNSNDSSKKTPVRVRNIVHKTDTRPPEYDVS